DGGSTMAGGMEGTDEGQGEAGGGAGGASGGGPGRRGRNAGVPATARPRRRALPGWGPRLATRPGGGLPPQPAGAAEPGARAPRRMSAPGRGGSISLMGSVMSVSSARLKSPYVTAKHGLAGLCQVIAREGAEHGVRCNIIEPGFVRTDLVEKQIPEQARALGL